MSVSMGSLFQILVSERFCASDSAGAPGICMWLTSKVFLNTHMIIEYIPTEVENVKKTFFFNYDRHLVTSSNSSVISLFSSLFLMNLHLPHT